MDIQKTITDLVAKFKGDDSLLSKFKDDPVKTVEGLIGVNLPDEQLKAVVSGIKAKLNLDSAGGLLDKVKGIFGK